MKSGKLSMRSFKSGRSVKSAPGEVFQLEEHLIMACKKYQCPYTVAVKTEYVCDESLAKNKKTTKAPATNDIFKDDLNSGDEKEFSTTSFEDRDTIKVTAIYDNSNNLLEIALTDVKDIPRVLIKSMCLIIPFYDKFTKISIQKSYLNPYTIYEISKILPVSTITDLCFDGSPFAEANFAILLETQTSLSSLSLSRCKINDEVCKQIASKLYSLTPTESCLKTLNLSSNHITNEGAKHIGEALRSNRHLRYLNLADNQIDDIGAEYIFDALKDFPMTSDEIRSKRQRYVEYLKLKQEVYSKYIRELKMTSIDATISQISRKSVKKRNSAISIKPKAHADKKNNENKTMGTGDCLSTKAELFAAGVMGSFQDPFNSDNINIQNGYTYCNGNMVLCYLNLSYNNLSYFSVKKLQEVLIYQSVCNKSYQTGLIRAMVEGNAIPEKCNEMNTINNLLTKSIVTRVQFDNVSKRPNRATKDKSLIEK